MARINFPDEWFDATVPEGVWKRFRHPSCSEGKNKALAIARTATGWVWHCHRCGMHGFKSADGLDPKRMMQWIKSVKEKPSAFKRDVDLPEDFEHVIPLKGLAWLYSKGITVEQIRHYNFGYSQFYDRVIMPVYENDKLIFWEGRYLAVPDKDHPKYMKVGQNRVDIYFKVEGHNKETIVLVEDILSAVRVGELVDTWAMLYAFIPDDVVFELAKHYKEILIWLDPDKMNKMIGWVSRYRSFGINVRIVPTNKDPKDYTREQIGGIIGKEII
jgi:DNA primase